MRLQSKSNLAIAVIALLMAVVSFADRTGRFGYRYIWALWLFGGLLWLYRAFRRAKSKT
jgi:hypothetical protein